MDDAERRRIAMGGGNLESHELFGRMTGEREILVQFSSDLTTFNFLAPELAGKGGCTRSTGAKGD